MTTSRGQVASYTCGHTTPPGHQHSATKNDEDEDEVEEDQQDDDGEQIWVNYV